MSLKSRKFCVQAPGEKSRDADFTKGAIHDFGGPAQILRKCCKIGAF